jgi:hypothetical protein
MSRAINIDATEAHVTTMCGKHSAVITSIESLRSGGTRVVLTNGDSAAVIRRAYGNKVIAGAVQRAPMRVAHSASAAIAPVASNGNRADSPSYPWKATTSR